MIALPQAEIYIYLFAPSPVFFCVRSEASSLEGRILKLELKRLWPPKEKRALNFGEDPEVGKDGRAKEEGTAKEEMVGWRHRLNEHDFGQTPVEDRRL